MEERSYKVYIHEFPNGKVYIGQTGTPVHIRWGSNGNLYKNQPVIWNAIQKYGWDNIVHDILEIDLTKEEADKKEIEWIEYYNSTDREFGYNVQNGGSSLGMHSEETKRKISESTKGEKNHFYGKTHSYESRKKISEANKKRDKATYPHRHVYQIDISTNKIIKDFFSVLEASRETGVYDSSIIMCCKGKIRQSGGYKWQYVDEPHEYIEKTGNKRKVVQLDIYGNYIATFNSIKEASVSTGVNESTISRSFLNITKTHKKYNWMYLDDYERGGAK